MNQNDINASAPETVTVLAEDWGRMVKVMELVNAYIIIWPSKYEEVERACDSAEERVGKRILALFAEKRP